MLSSFLSLHYTGYSVQELRIIVMRLPLLLAWRFLKSSHEKSISTMLRICFVSIVIGTGSLTLIAAIMNGFEQATHKKLQGIHADVTISAQGKTIDFPKLQNYLATAYQDQIAAASPSSLHHVMLEVPLSKDTYESSICVLKAVEPSLEKDVSHLNNYFCAGTTWASLDHGIFMGERLARQLNLVIGSLVTLLYHTQDDTILKIKVPVTGMFNTGIHDLDEQVIIGSYELVDTLFPHTATEVSCSLAAAAHEEITIQSLRDDLSLEVHSWKDRYTPLVAALTLEKYAMWVILLLVTLVASLTMVSLLYMYGTHKKTDIALLASQGMAASDLRMLFVAIATFITFSATITGVLLALFGTWILATYPFITLPDVYYVSHLPAQLNGTILVSVMGIALVISIGAGIFPNARITMSQLSSLLKGMV